MPAPLMRGFVVAILSFAILGQGNAQDLRVERQKFADALTALSKGERATFRNIERQLTDYPFTPTYGTPSSRAACLARHLPR